MSRGAHGQESMIFCQGEYDGGASCQVHRRKKIQHV
jgi:hypothetical protein